jgi:putative nucleotidyltransferase with HDIG domain
MLSKDRSGLRLTFLGKFFLVTFVLAALVTNALAHFLISRHEAAVEANEGANAAGQIAALATGPLARVSTDGGAATPATRAAIANVDAQAKRLQYVIGIRVYASDGRALYPANAPDARDDVRRTLQTGNLWSRNAASPSGEALRVEYVPFVSARSIFVIAIDLSRAQMAAQAGSEAESVRLATLGAIALLFIALTALAAGASRELERRRRESQQTLVTTLSVLAAAIDRRDPYTAGHSRRVADYSRLLAEGLGFPARECDTIEYAALLHDLGKIGIPDAVLLKPTHLDSEERRIIGAHPKIGAEIIASCGTMGDVVPCVMHHHERVDGTGYPDKLANDAIPRGARVIAVADTFDAMTTDRPYRRALSIDSAVAELRRVAGKQLDPRFVAAFERLVRCGAIVPPQPAPLDADLTARFGPLAARG